MYMPSHASWGGVINYYAARIARTHGLHSSQLLVPHAQPALAAPVDCHTLGNV